MLAVGLMSGTSLDGIDAAVVELVPRSKGYHVVVHAFKTIPFPHGMRDMLLCAMPPNTSSPADFARLHQAMGILLADAVQSIRGSFPIDFVASHGQTIFHDGEAHRTWQIGDAFVIRERTGLTVCYDFRSGDTAVGGHGAPLVPYVDQVLFASEHESRVALNIGGISNLTYLPAANEPGVVAFDVGPGMMLLDGFIATRTQGRQLFDRDAEVALRGRVDSSTLALLLTNPYFAAPIPKSAGREEFGSIFLQQHEATLSHLSLEDGCATLAALSASVIADALKRFCPRTSRMLCSGGGVHHVALMQGIQERLPEIAVETTATMGLDPDAKEAVAFAILGFETLRGRPANMPAATGARKSIPLGAIAPMHLHELFMKVDQECHI